MKVTGFTIIKNAITYDYPVVEAITSILSICDEFVVAVGQSTDETRDLIMGISPKIRIVDTVWDESIRENGTVLALETDKALAAISKDTDWAFYIQADEVVHEQYLETIQKAMQQYQHCQEVDGLLFNYLHFYGSYDYVASSAQWYKNEIRIIKINRLIYSYRDAQGFRKLDNQKLNVKAVEAFIYHYGWVKSPAHMQTKQQNFNKYWHDDKWMEQYISSANEFDYSNIDQLIYFKGSHPRVMQPRIDRLNWTFEHDMSKNKFSLKESFKAFLKKHFHITLGYKNYKLR